MALADRGLEREQPGDTPKRSPGYLRVSAACGNAPHMPGTQRHRRPIATRVLSPNCLFQRALSHEHLTAIKMQMLIGIRTRIWTWMRIQTQVALSHCHVSIRT